MQPYKFNLAIYLSHKCLQVRTSSIWQIECFVRFQDEQIVDRYLDHLKWQEFQATKQSGFPPARPIEETFGHILNSTVFRILKMLPKGGNMHTHESKNG